MERFSAPQDITIRKAVKEDCPRILELVRELAEFEKAAAEVTVSLAEMEDAGFGSSPVWWAFVAECGGQIVGIALYYIRYSTWKGKMLYLEDIVVTEACRGRGIGKRLFEATAREANRLSVHGMIWQVLDWNRPALDFYRKYHARIDGSWLNATLDGHQLSDY